MPSQPQTCSGNKRLARHNRRRLATILLQLRDMDLDIRARRRSRTPGKAQRIAKQLAMMISALATHDARAAERIERKLARIGSGAEQGSARRARRR